MDFFTIQLAKKIFQAEPKPVWEIPTGVGCLLMLTFGFTDRRCWRSASLVQRFCKKSYWEGVWPSLHPWDVAELRTTVSAWNVPGKYGPHGELFFFLVKKEPVVASDDEASNPFVSAETLKACALIGLQLLAAEDEAGSSRSQSLDLGDMWRCGWLPK